MTETQKIDLVNSLLEDAAVSDELCATYMKFAADRILIRAYPHGNGPSELPAKYDNILCELTARMILRRGGEGELAHNENGISRTYASVDDEDILRRIMPHVGVF